MHKHLLLLLAWLFPWLINAQNCVIHSQNTIICQGNSNTLSVSFDAGFTPQSYSWNFGNSVTSSQAAPVYIYPKTGSFTPTLTVHFTGGQQCTVNGPILSVVGKPHPAFSFTGSTLQCFKNNQICIRDLSVKDTSSKGIMLRMILWDDGTLDTSHIAAQTYCHNYTSPFGGYYSIALEVTDSNHCISRITKTDSVRILQKMQAISFSTQYTKNCNITPVNFFNSSSIPKAQVKRFWWIFDDGSIDSSNVNWSTTTHNYTITGTFNPSLIVENLDGCRDTFTLYNGASNTSLAKKITISSTNKCVTTQDYAFTLNPSSGATYAWQLFDMGGKVIDTSSFFIFSVNKNKVQCGPYRVHIHATLASCTTDADTIIELFGPDAKITKDKKGPVYNTQCHITDTVFYVNPNPDFSCYYKDAIKRLWDFGDPFAPACTLDTKNNQNIGLNCRYSKDSANVKHWYNPAHEQCYAASIYLEDIVTGCFDSDTTGISLMPPNAHPDTSATHPRKGLQIIGKPCLHQIIKFDISQTLPACNRTNAWVLPDSAAGSNWIPFDTGTFVKPYTYGNTKDTSGWVTVGLIIQNGDCFDTAWYHNRMQLLPINPNFTVHVQSVCAPYYIELIPADTLQDSIQTVEWIINGQLKKTQTLGLSETYIQPLRYTELKGGAKDFILAITNRKGCKEVRSISLPLGFSMQADLSKEIVCLNDSVRILDDIKYYGSPVRYWENPLRAAVGKEHLDWYIGSKHVTISHPYFKASQIGNDSIRLIATDSVGCRDTLQLAQTIKVVSLKANIDSMQRIFVCAPKIATFHTSSTVIDSSKQYNQTPYDVISTYTWNFGDKSPSSDLQNPVHSYIKNDSFHVSLVVQTMAGCADTAETNIRVLGPNPSFSLLSGDTLGCAPQSITLKNTSGKGSTHFIFNSNGTVNSSQSFTTDTNVVFTYNQSGTYSITLTAEEIVHNPYTGNDENCTVTYPDATHPFSFSLLDKPISKLWKPDSICVGKEFTLTASCNHNLKLFDFIIDQGHNPVLRLDSVFKYTFQTSGPHSVLLVSVLNNSATCNDSISAHIYAAETKADFNPVNISNGQYHFQNTSQFCDRFTWYFYDKNAGKSDSSKLREPDYTFIPGNDSAYVCLKGMNDLGCIDSTCKSLFLLAKSLVIPNVFTPGNDGLNDVFDIQIQGFSVYKLSIFDRWGMTVFESDKDGIGNDGNNWNGKNKNSGSECASGTYFYIFTYRFADSKTEQTIRGTISLIR